MFLRFFATLRLCVLIVFEPGGAGEPKHNIAEEYLKTTKVKQGLFLILVGRAQVRVWDLGWNHQIEAKSLAA
jgi:hypothetical protein